MDYISIDDFKKVEARIGTVVAAEAIEGSDKLLKLQVDFGEESPRQILSGIKAWYDPEVLVGKSMLFCTNLAPRPMMGLVSHGMLMAVDGPDGAPVFLVPEHSVNRGAKVR